jgi:predicted NBD/HSP70 family sugar kinase
MVDSRSEPAWAWPDLHDAQRAVLLEVLINGSASRAELARRTGLSRTSLTRLARDLVELGFLTEGETNAPNGRGRPSEILNLQSSAAQFAGVKLTGEALYAVVTDLQANVIELEEQSLVSRYAPDAVSQIAEIVRGFSASHPRLASVGVCLAGDVEQVRGRAVIVGSYFLGWDNVPLESLVEAEIGLPIAMSNDVQALTAAHHWFGAGVGRRSLVLFGLGAGIGAGIVVNDELVRGSHGHPGKVGHIPVRHIGPTCDRGHVGCASAYVTIPAILHNAADTSFERVLERAAAGDRAAQSALDDAGYALGVVVAQLMNVIDPEKVIVTGEGLAVARAGKAAMDIALAERLEPASERSEIDVRDFAFADYAWAAAVSAIRRVV